MQRRTFIKSVGLGAAALSARAFSGEENEKRPNLLVIITDQQFADCMSGVMGDQYLKTPHMDALAANGMLFTRAYSPNPLCIPMRTSAFTGRFPHETGVQDNSTRRTKDRFPLMGKRFKEAGYETAYFGKWHIAGVNEGETGTHGFDKVVGKEGACDPKPAADFLSRKHDRPFLAIASFLGPHEICQWSRKEEIPGEQLGPVPPLDERPPMRPNSGVPKNETDIMAHMRKSYQATRGFPVGVYTEDDWRRLIWGYYRLIERVDGYIGTVMKALRDSGQEENTVVVFLSDHGDCHGAHRWNQKTVFYDESARVPFIVSQKGTTPKGTCNVLLNTGTDLIPTLCEFAGIPVPDELPGKSLKAHALGRPATWQRDYVVSQNHMIQCEKVDNLLVKPHGRMVRSADFKYCLYDSGKKRESLIDMKNDPGEMVNQAENPDFKSILDRHRGYLKDHAVEHKDEKAAAMLKDIGVA